MTTRITSENITDATITIADLATSVPLNTQWQAVKTSTFTAVAGQGYFVNSGSALTMNLPAGSAGATVVVVDYARNFATYNLTVSPNGSEKIGGIANPATLNIDGQAATFVYVDATKGWVNTQNAEDTETGVIPYMEATGGTITESGNFKIHTFTGDGNFVVSRLATESPAPAFNKVSYIVVAGGGGGGGTQNTTHVGAGGGAGGYRGGRNQPVDPYTESPLCASTGIAVTATSFPITVGGGGALSPPASGQSRGASGSNSVFSTITSAGGGGGGGLGHPSNQPCRSGAPGGSGGGGSSQVAGSGGSGNTPPVSPPQGSNGAQGIDSPPDLRGGGGGGATAAGTQGAPPATTGRGGAGATVHITGSPVGYAGGGGGGATSAAGPGTSQASPCGSGGAGGSSGGAPYDGSAGVANRGGGGGGAAGHPGGAGDKLGGNGGKGVVILRYRFQ